MLETLLKNRRNQELIYTLHVAKSVHQCPDGHWQNATKRVKGKKGSEERSLTRNVRHLQTSKPKGQGNSASSNLHARGTANQNQTTHETQPRTMRQADGWTDNRAWRPCLNLRPSRRASRVVTRCLFDEQKKNLIDSFLHLAINSFSPFTSNGIPA